MKNIKSFIKGINIEPVVSSGVNAEGDIEIFSNGLRIYLQGAVRTVTTLDQIQTLTNKTMSGSSNTFSNIGYASLVLTNSIVNADINASAGIVYSKLNLTDGIVNTDVSASAAIAYSKLNLSASIVNADISNSAAITRSKMATGAANGVLFNDASGNISQNATQLYWDITNTRLGIGTSAPDYKLSVSVASDTAAASFASQSITTGSGLRTLIIQNAGTNPSNGIEFRTSRGTLASPTQVTSGTSLGAIEFSGYGVGGFNQRAVRISANAEETFTGSANGGGLTISAVQAGTTTLTTRMVMDGNGNFVFGGTTPVVRMDIGGDLALRQGSDNTSSGTLNNVSAASFSNFRFTLASGITGFSGGVDGKLLVIQNANSTAITISNESASSTAANRIITGTGADISIPVGGVLTLIYDNTASRWRVAGGAGSAITSLTGDVTATGPGSAAATIANDAVTNAKLANMATQTIKGRTTAGTGDPEDLTATQVTAILNAFTGDSGSGGVKGLVPAPASGDAAANKFLKADGTWTAISATADVQGPASSTDNALVRFDGTTGKLIQNSSVIVDDSNNVSGVVDLTTTGRVVSSKTATSSDANRAVFEPTLTINDATGHGVTNRTGAILATVDVNISIPSGSVDIIRTRGTVASSMTITNYSAIRLAPPTNSGTITNYRALWIPSLAGGTSINRAIQVDDGEVFFGGTLASGQENNTVTGTGASMTAPVDVVVRLTDASLVSLNNIVAATGRILVLSNVTGNSISIINNSGGTAANRIITGTGVDLTLENNASLILYYDDTTTRWRVVGGSGSGGSSANTALSNLASVAINTSLVSDTDNTDDLGTNTVRWRNVFAVAVKDASSNNVIDVTNRQLTSGATVKLDWSGTDVSLNSRKLTNVSTPTANSDAATKEYVDEYAITTKTTGYTAVAGTDKVILCDATSGSFTITLPAASGNSGVWFSIKKTDSSANAITVDGNASETIDGVLTQILSNQYQSITIVCNGSNWFII